MCFVHVTALIIVLFYCLDLAVSLSMEAISLLYDKSTLSRSCKHTYTFVMRYPFSGTKISNAFDKMTQLEVK